MMPFLFAKFTAIPVFGLPASCHSFFFIPPWYEYLNLNSSCGIQDFNFPGDFLQVGLAMLDILLRIAGFVAVISIMIAGLEYMTSSGDPQKAAAARSRIYNSLIGLIIALVATAIVTFIGKSLT